MSPVRPVSICNFPKSLLHHPPQHHHFTLKLAFQLFLFGVHPCRTPPLGYPHIPSFPGGLPDLFNYKYRRVPLVVLLNYPEDESRGLSNTIFWGSTRSLLFKTMYGNSYFTNQLSDSAAFLEFTSLHYSNIGFITQLRCKMIVIDGWFTEQNFIAGRLDLWKVTDSG